MLMAVLLMVVLYLHQNEIAGACGLQQHKLLYDGKALDHPVDITEVVMRGASQHEALDDLIRKTSLTVVYMDWVNILL